MLKFINSHIISKLFSTLADSECRHARLKLRGFKSLKSLHVLILAAMILLITPEVAMAQTIGHVLTNIRNEIFAAFPILIHAFAYIAGAALTIWGIVNLRDHADNPQQTPISDPVKKLVVAGALFAMPTIVNAAYRTIVGGNIFEASLFGGLLTFIFDAGGELEAIGGAAPNLEDATGGAGGLDVMMSNLVDNIFWPMHWVVTAFSFVAGLIFIFIGITRLLKTSQEGPRGPGGFGTIMTFLVAGVLFAVAPMLGAFSSTFFGTNEVINNAVVGNSVLGDVLDPNAVDHVNLVINSITGFMMVVGLISFVRGFFLLREFADTGGQSQNASLMAALTHIIGGAVLVNLGWFVVTVQNSLGLGEFGYIFPAPF